MQNIWTVIWYHIAQSENIKWTPLYHMEKKIAVWNNYPKLKFLLKWFYM